MKNQLRWMRFAGLVIGLLLTIVCVSAQTQEPPSSVTPVPAKVINDPNVPTGWRRYQFGDAPLFSVILPAAPEVSAERAPEVPNAVVSLYVSLNENAIYAASRIEGLGLNMESASEGARQLYFKNYIEGFGRGFQTSMKQNNIDHELKMLPPTKVKAAGRNAYQQDFTVGPFTGRAQLTFAGSSAFCIMTVGNQRTPAADREIFLNSLQLTGTPK
jgi:hypothetical protein